LVASLGTAVALLVTPPASAEHRTDNRAYVGITVPFDGGKFHTPKAVVGIQSLRVNASDSVVGADANVQLNVFDGEKNVPFVDSVRLGMVGGNRSVQGVLSGGYSFTDNQPLLSGAVQAPHVRVGSDYVFGAENAWRPYGEINTLGKLNAVASSRGGGDIEREEERPPDESTFCEQFPNNPACVAN
jgi:hypothetical protein